MRRKHVILFVVGMFLTWNALMYFTLVTKAPTPQHTHGDVRVKLNNLQEQIELQLQENKKILDDLRKLKEDAEKQQVAAAGNEAVAQVPVPEKTVKPNGTGPLHGAPPAGAGVIGSRDPDSVVLPLLMMACNRKDAVSRSLDQVLKYRKDERRFPIIVSQDCGHKETADTIQKYVKEKGIKHIQQPDLSKIEVPWPQRKFEGYYKIARHYKWALNQVFHYFNHSAVIIVEDDLDISPDFYEYFAATFRVLNKDPSLWCVSAWNDNGKKGMVKEDSELLHRTDFFPGLGWMMERKTWLEIGPNWPPTFWDDWMRHPDQRRDRSCIRPELSRTSTFGKIGVSKGLFYDKHLKFIQLNDKFVPFTQRNLSYLLKEHNDPAFAEHINSVQQRSLYRRFRAHIRLNENYDPAFGEHIYSVPQISLAEVQGRKRQDLEEVRVTYKTKLEFKDIAKKLGIMDDFKAGVERTAYRGVVSFSFNGQRVHVAPPIGWKAYDPTWT